MKQVTLLRNAYQQFLRSDYNTKGLFVCFIAATVLALGVRYRLLGVVTPDFTDFLQPWLEHMHAYGLSGLGDDFSNYNTPYLILLLVASYLPFSELANVKLISIGFDFVLASSVFLVVRHYFPNGKRPYIGFLAVLFAPVVIQNGAMWGQCDAIYTSFLVLAFYAYLKNKLYMSWILWGVAFAFKLQAIFFLPFLIFLTLYLRGSLIGPLYAVVAFAVLSFAPLLFGKSIQDVLSVYIGQTTPIRTDFGLAWFSPTAYQWISNHYFEFVRQAGIVYGAFVALSVISLAFLRKYSQKTILAIATASLLAIPFFLPTIHERYLFSGEIFLIILSLISFRFIWMAVLMQIISTVAYTTYFTQANELPAFPFATLSLGVLVIIATLVRYIYQSSEQKIPVSKKPKT